MSKQHLGDNEFLGALKIGAATKQATLDASGLTANRTLTIPDAAGTLALTGDLASYLPLAGGILTGDITIKTGTPEIAMLSPGSVNGYDILANVSDTVDAGLLLRHWNGSAYDTVLKILETGITITPPNPTQAGLTISGAFTGNGRIGSSFVNSTADTSNSYIVSKFAAGATANGQVGQIGAEYTAAPVLTGRTILENIGGSGVLISALAAGTDIQFGFGSSRSVLAKITSAGEFYTYGVSMYGDDKAMVQFSDTWLRLNPANDFTSGIYAGTGILRTDGTLQVGSAGTYFQASSAGVFYAGIEVGFRNIPLTLKNANYTLTAGDAGKGLYHTDATARSWTVPPSVFNIGDVVTFVNYDVANISLLQGTGVSLYMAGTTGATNGTRTIGKRGICTMMCVASNSFFCSGVNVS